MGKLEEEEKKLIKRGKIQEAILLTLASGGRLGAELIVEQAIEHLTGIDYPLSKRKNETIKSAASRLRQKGLIQFKDGYYSLTDSGKLILDKWQMSRYKIEKPRKWDNKWRVIIFDIPEKKRGLRTRAREILKVAGFQRLQDSVWVFPYDCEDVIGLMKTDMGIGKYLLYMIVDQLENDRFLRMDFDLI
ncbi:MAG: CRISPR-associated endonuclease Cas2 [Patescibacteria group bacterium]